MLGTCFVVMPYEESFNKVYKSIELSVIKNGLKCIRSDYEKRTGKIYEQIVEQIISAKVCIVDLSNDPRYNNSINANVLYETGFAHALQENIDNVILISRDDPNDLPFDLKVFRVIFYNDNLDEFEKQLNEYIAELFKKPESNKRLLKQMLFPNSISKSQSPFVIATCPLSFRTAFRREGGWNQSPTTFSDYLGIRGILQAFGNIFGIERLPELINPDDYRKNVLKREMNLYCIGSSKANRWTGWIMEEFFTVWNPVWKFHADPKSSDILNPLVMISKDGKEYPPPTRETSRVRWDFGLLIRGPIDIKKNTMLMVMAGRSALGTQAACLAATDPSKISLIKRKLDPEVNNIDFDDHRDAFYAVVSMKAKIVPNEDEKSNQWKIETDSFKVHEAEKFSK